jgi:hypothetical protein
VSGWREGIDPRGADRTSDDSDRVTAADRASLDSCATYGSPGTASPQK